MPDILDTGALTWCAQEATEVLIKPTFFTPENERMVDIMLGVKSSRKIVLDNILRDIVQADDGCGRTPAGEVIVLSEKFMQLCYIKVNLDQCATNLRDTMFEEKLKSGLGTNDLEGTDVADYILTKVQDALRMDIFTILWFGDTNSADSTLQLCTGLWTRIIQETESYNITRAHVFSDPLGDCESLTAFQAMWAQQSKLLKSRPKSEKYLAVTSSVYENWRKCIEDKCCGEYGVRLLVEGSERLYFRGMEVIEVTYWDEIIESKSLSFPHRAILTLKDNLKLGTDVTDDFNQIKIMYNPFDDKTQIDAKFSMGTLIVYNELTIVAY